MKFIYVGIADTIDELLTHHESASRYIAAIMLPRLHLGVLKAMAKTGFETLGIEVNDPMLWRIAYISDGFAHFTHLICLKTALRLLDECSPPRRLTAQAIEGGLRDAIDASEVWLRQVYEDATKKYKDDYERVLWAAADHWEIERNTGHMFPCYERICADMGKEALPRHKFSLKLNALKRPEHGRALISNRSSWYKFRLTMLRGYCRMKAEARGVSVGLDYLENRAPALVGATKATKASGGDNPNG